MTTALAAHSYDSFHMTSDRTQTAGSDPYICNKKTRDINVGNDFKQTISHFGDLYFLLSRSALARWWATLPILVSRYTCSLTSAKDITLILSFFNDLVVVHRYKQVKTLLTSSSNYLLTSIDHLHGALSVVWDTPFPLLRPLWNSDWTNQFCLVEVSSTETSLEYCHLAKALGE